MGRNLVLGIVIVIKIATLIASRFMGKRILNNILVDLMKKYNID